MRNRQRFSIFAGFVLVWAVILFALAASVCGTAGNGELLAREMLRAAPPEQSGLPEAEYPGMGRMIAGYLTGREEVFQYAFSDAEGNRYSCFHDYEADHMADCRGLIRLAGTLRWVFAGLALAAGGAVLFRKRRKAFARGMLRGLAAAGAALLALTLWGLIDFDGLFVAFHRLAFTNDGWLLDPRTDLLIRLMPLELFISLGLRILLWMAAAAAAAGAAAWMMTGIERCNHEL